MVRFLVIIIASLCFSGNIVAQAPSWVATTPSTGTPGPVSIPVNYGINMTGTVYMIVFNYDYAGTLTSTAVRNSAIGGPSGLSLIHISEPTRPY